MPSERVQRQIELRGITEGDFDLYARAANRAFGVGMPADDREDELRTFEFDRAIAAMDGSDIVGTASAYSFEMTVPGGTMPTAGVTWVAVQPTHRRRGVLTSMMQQQLSDVRDRGEPLALLLASESNIYERFGYGIAVPHEHWEIERNYAQFTQPVEAPGRVLLVERADARRIFPAVYARAVLQRPGMIARSDPWWDIRLREGKEKSDVAQPMFYAVYEDGHDVEGYAIYRPDKSEYERPDKSEYEFRDAYGRRTLRVHEQVDVTREANASLWQFLLGIDLISTVLDLNRPIDDALPWMLADPRRLKRRVDDHNWLRLVHVEAALAGRTYARDARLVLDVRDTTCPWNDGRYSLESGQDGSSHCERTKDESDLTLDVATLATAFLGATPFSVLGQAGRIDELTAGSLQLADAMFRVDRAPWNVVSF